MQYLYLPISLFIIVLSLQDILAIVVNVDSPTYAANGARIQDLIVMDNQ